MIRNTHKENKKALHWHEHLSVSHRHLHTLRHRTRQVHECAYLMQQVRSPPSALRRRGRQPDNLPAPNTRPLGRQVVDRHHHMPRRGRRRLHSCCLGRHMDRRTVRGGGTDVRRSTRCAHTRLGVVGGESTADGICTWVRRDRAGLRLRHVSA